MSYQKKINRIILAAAALAFSSTVQADKLSVRVEPPDWYKLLNQDRTWNIILSGEIDSDAPARVAKALKQTGNDGADVFLNSPGGNLFAGMQLGRVLREAGVNCPPFAHSATFERIAYPRPSRLISQFSVHCKDV
ncbi:hypothetical protein [Herbaspirillum sp. SJZ107]|uniref:hypothetical protein n=1 Tax=Herbaspirillum sp. SJZ107 TaxID=2572881 RepID=UPI0021078531|nr:hypothetical protein [Herbaspirillum sp. SJZ107]